MPSPIPQRSENVYLLGAGFSSAFGLPNTPSLISEVLAFAKDKAWLESTDLPGALEAAFKFFYPDADHEGFQPDVVDFFSTLRTYLDVGAGLVGTGLKEAPELYRLLRRALAHLLIDKLRAVDTNKLIGHARLSEIVRPGNIIITTNWDVLVEHYSDIMEIPLRLTSDQRRFSSTEVTLLKLHGSIDWCQIAARAAGYGDKEYAGLQELQFSDRSRRVRLPKAQSSIVRIRALPGLNTAWQLVKSRAREPYMVTMATGKSDDLGPLRDVWRDAYRALSRAKRIEVIGYSMPPDDIEIRTLLRTGLQRGQVRPQLVIQNPAPDVHLRVRAYLDRSAESDYLPFPGCN